MEDHTGKVYGLLTVLAEADRAGRTRRVVVRCGCQEATEKVVRLCHLRSGHTTSCGCAQRVATKKSNTTHGLKKHALYHVWKDMLNRCQNLNCKTYHHYGGRGVEVCERWQSIENFIADMELTFKEGLTLDRKDNNQGYSPENCRWATRAEQNRNTRRNVNITLEGRTQCLEAWCKELGIKRSTVYYRLKSGKTPEQALTT
jgi:hypothetical protein